MDTPHIHPTMKGLMPPSSDYNSRISRNAGYGATVSRTPFNRSTPQRQAYLGKEPHRAPASPGRTNELMRVPVTDNAYQSSMWRDPYTHGPHGLSMHQDAVKVDGAFLVPRWDGIPQYCKPAPIEGTLLSSLPGNASLNLHTAAETQGLEAAADAMLQIHHAAHWQKAQQAAATPFSSSQHPSVGTPRTVTYISPRHPVSASRHECASTGPAGKAWRAPTPSYTSGGGGWRVAMRHGCAPTRACDLNDAVGAATPANCATYRWNGHTGSRAYEGATPEYHHKASALSVE